MRLDGQRLGDFELIRRIVEHQVETLQQHRHHQLRFLHRERTTDAGARAVAERLPCVGRERRRVLGREAFGTKGLDVVPPHRGIAMKHRLENQQCVARRERIASSEHGVCHRLDREGRCGRPEAQRLHQRLLDVAQLREMLDAGQLGAQHLVDDLLRLKQDLRILQQQIGRERQQAAGGLVTGDEKGHELETDVLVGKLFAGHGIDAVQHVVEQILLLETPGILTTLGDQAFGHA